MWIRHVVMSLMACVLLVSPAWAEEADYNEAFLQNAATADGVGASIAVDRYTTVALDITIAGTATVNFEGSVLGSAATAITCTSSADATSYQAVTATAMVQCNVAGFKAVRARISDCAACTVTVYARATSAILGRGGSGGGGVTGWPSVITAAAATTEAAPIKIRGTGANSDDGWNLYTHTNGTPTIKCVIGNVEGDCDVTVSLNAGKKYQIKDSGGNVIFEVDEAAKYTTFTDERHFRVASCNNATPSAVFDLPTANAPEPLCEGTNTRTATLDFNDTTDESFADSWTLPASFKGTINVHFRWKAAAIVGSVAWCAQLVRVPDGATSDPALPAQAVGNCVSDVAKGTTLQENDATITGVTCTACVAGDRVNVVISRDPNETSTRTDTLVGDAKLITYGRTIR